MPISDFIRNFLQALPENIQYLGTGVPWTSQMGVEQRARAEREAAGQQAQTNWEKQFGFQQQSEQDRMQQEAMANMFRAISAGFQPVQPHPSQAEPTLTGQGPSLGAGGGQQGAGQAIPQVLPTLGQMLGEQASQGQQQQPGMGVNAPGSMPGGIMTTPSDRMATANAATGGGGVVQPARTPAQQILPTVNIPNMPGGMSGALEFNPQYKEPTTYPVGAELASKVPGLTAGMSLPPAQYMEAIKMAQGTGGKPASDNEVLLQSRLIANGSTKDWREVAKTDPALFAKARSEMEEIINPAMAAQKRAQEADLAQKLKLSKTEEANAVSFWERVKDDPSVWFGKDADKNTRTYAEQLARQRGETAFIPRQELTTERQTMQTYSLDVKAMNGELRGIASELLQRDPRAFGALVGRWTEANKLLGTPVSNDPRVNYLVGRFKDLVNPMVARETKQVSGGRAAVQMMNMLKQSLPSLHDHPDYLRAAFDNTDFIANVIQNSNKRYMFGRFDPKELTPGDPIKKGGKTYHFKQYTPSGDIETVEQ